MPFHLRQQPAIHPPMLRQPVASFLPKEITRNSLLVAKSRRTESGATEEDTTAILMTAVTGIEDTAGDTMTTPIATATIPSVEEIERIIVVVGGGVTRVTTATNLPARIAAS